MTFFTVNLQQGIIKDLSVKLQYLFIKIVSIVTSLLHTNYQENLMTRFSAKKNNCKGLFIFICVAMATAYTSA